MKPTLIQRFRLWCDTHRKLDQPVNKVLWEMKQKGWVRGSVNDTGEAMVELTELGKEVCRKLYGPFPGDPKP